VKRWTIHERPSAAQIEEIAALLRSGAVVLMPTDTIYGLHAMATEASAARIASMAIGPDVLNPDIDLSTVSSRVLPFN